MKSEPWNECEQRYNAPMLLGVPSFDAEQSLGRTFYCREIGFGYMTIVSSGGYDPDAAVKFTFEEESWLGEQIIHTGEAEIPFMAEAVIQSDSIAKEALGQAIEQARSIENLREHAVEIAIVANAIRAKTA